VDERAAGVAAAGAALALRAPIVPVIAIAAAVTAGARALG
ncbi:MAG: AzlD domain-containing protein, partial [Solirubrobacterales bacterium]